MARDIRPDEGIDILRATGVQTEVNGPADLILDGQLTEVKIRQYPPTPADVRRDLHRGRAMYSAYRLVYFVSNITDALRAVAAQLPQISIVGVDEGEVVIGGRTIRAEKVDRISQPNTRHGRVSWGRFGLMRILARTEEPRTQDRLAAEAGVSQAAVSKLLPSLPASKVAGGWRVLDRDALFKEFMSQYPGPLGITEYWYGLDSIVKQATTAADTGDEWLLSGDAAADDIAPWRVAGRAVIYAKKGVDLAHFGFAESDQSEATLELVVPADPTIWPTARSWSRSRSRTVDPLIAAWDVQRTGGPDSTDAVEKLREAAMAGSNR